MTKFSSILTNAFYIAFLLPVLLFCLPEKAYPQFMDLHLDIDSELTARTEHPLNFGTIQANSGRQAIEFGDVNMGIFSITALEKQLLLVMLNKPKNLSHDNPAVEDRIPVYINARYGYNRQDFRDAELLHSSTIALRVKENSNSGPWNTIYLFLYGSIEVGNVAEGIYSNNIILEVQYI